jgi:cysteine desulfurase
MKADKSVLVMSVYLDNAASTGVHPEVVEAMLPYFREHFGNPSSHHAAGTFVHEAVEAARGTISSVVNAEPDELLFTSGGTEADHLAVVGASLLAPANRRHIIVSAIEHQAVLRAAEQLSQNGFSLTILNPDSDGVIQTEAVAAAIRPDTFLVSVMMVNNEIGTIQSLEKISAVLKPRGILFHSDAVQALGKLPLDVRRLGVDLLSLSAHKIHGPKGIGALFVRHGVRLKPLLPGGGQEYGIRSGTENVPAIVGFAKAVEIANTTLARTSNKVRPLRDKLESAILSALPGTKLATSSPNRSPYITNILFPMVDNSYLLNRLNAAGVYVTSGSACASHSLEPSHVLLAMGMDENLARSAIRFSLSHMTCEDDINQAVESVLEIVQPFIMHVAAESQVTV